MSLREYKRKRHFTRTPEPAGTKASRRGRLFVIQKHDASHLHYDFRLELDGVLLSWAVPKGPSLDPSVKRLAMHVEDHPVDYGSFEGTIPEGEYGGGTVMLWDRGEWEPIGDPHEGYHQGKLKFLLHGEKLHGGWVLVRTHGRDDRDDRRWLLFKEHDDDAQSSADGDVLQQAPLSVKTGRDLDQIAAGMSARNGKKHSNVKHSNGKHANGQPKKARQRKSNGITKGKLPTDLDVELATLARDVPDGDEWFHEIKFDGYRMICRIDGDQVDFVTRNHKSWTGRLPSLVEAARRLPVRQAILDGEVVALRPDGTSDFQDLQNAFRDRREETLFYYVFDLLHLDGADLTSLPLEERKELLGKLLSHKKLPAQIRLSEHVVGNGSDFFKQACRAGLEGVVCKRRDRPYRAGRGFDWLKVKCMQKDEFVIGGYTDPGGSRTAFGALHVGYHDETGKLRYAGKIGTGFDERMLQTLLERFKPLQRDASPFSDYKHAARGTHWVEPTLVAQIAFGSWTRDGRLRHGSFQGLREDKPAGEVTRDRAVPVASAERKAETPTPIATKDEFAGVRLTHPDKVLYPDQGVTKLELAQYYQSVADWILPHLANRPLVLVRCPDGQGKACFYQKHPAAGTPEALRRIFIEEEKKTGEYVIVDDLAGLISLAQIGALEIHAWGARADRIERPDYMVFDLDPDPQVAWPRVVQGAYQVRDFLEDLGLISFVKTTGGKGLHIVVPIERRHEWNEVRTFCKQVADMIVAADPAHYTANMAKKARPGKIFVDYLRNGRGATAVAPYSTRARSGAPVSTPLAWAELTARVHSDQYTIRNLPRRLASLREDPWQEYTKTRQTLSGASKKLADLAAKLASRRKE